MAMPIIIVEGPDCSGKTTLIEQIRTEFTHCNYVHFGAFKNVKKSLARIYVEAAMPAILDHELVIMDRSWLSELPYGKIFRPNESLRVDCADIRMLERLFLTCDPLVVYCNTGWLEMKKCFVQRSDSEYLDDTLQLHQVRLLYKNSMAQTHLPVHHYNWITDSIEPIMDGIAQRVDEANTSEKLPGVGSKNPQILVVGDKFADHQEFDPLYQWPFASFSNQGCSRWLATQLDKQRIPESQLRWINHDQLTNRGMESMLRLIPGLNTIICLGDTAHQTVTNLSVLYGKPGMNIRIEQYPHPQWWKRFSNNKQYTMILRLKELIHERN